ncbi:chromosome segregation ATPase [Peptoniphilus koenoeneniae]|uniref:Chromosome segregation ATPase n=1 Tax=Peptoniphilus koenoeneniae TaxID=507751 RepID=A0ABU0AS53_9FIRM|nr:MULTISPECIES: hypothetical protein [Peptoniphilus]ERT56706.1 hypothetical protein HMPREF1253_1543 [Peptoniphilus sp. BV3C26]MDQ0274082.1 chromosome segregation ATPase [Peptoniphilus koenoeneniae]
MSYENKEYNNYEKEIETLKNKINKASQIKSTAVGRLEALEGNKEELIKKLKELNVDPENLDNEILKLQKEIENLISEANSLLPEDL